MKAPMLAGSLRLRVVAALLLCIHPHIASSEDAVARTRPVDSRVTRSTAEDTVTQRAAQWGLKSAEWERYVSLMDGPLGIQSPGLDPVTALGIEARTDAERQRYAELQVHLETTRVDKILAYQRAYDAAFRRLHPNLRRVDPLRNGLARATTETPADATRIALFVKPDCAACDEKVRALIRDNASFDIYVVGTRKDDKLIRGWAQRVGIDPVRVRAGAITLNHDSGRWLSLGERGELPALVRNVNGRWVRM
jgi:integrating conjugative element protein (TIGR03759 family)